MSIAIFAALGAAGVPGFKAFAGRPEGRSYIIGDCPEARRVRAVKISFIPNEGGTSGFFDCEAIDPEGHRWRSANGVWECAQYWCIGGGIAASGSNFYEAYERWLEMGGKW